MRALAVAVVLFADPSVKPWPIGPGPRYLPSPAPAAVLAGKPVGSLRCGSDTRAFRVHLELFAGRRVIVVPAGIGVAAPDAHTGATVTPRGCWYPLRTLAPGGVVDVQRGAALTVGDLFRIWGQALGTYGLASFQSSSPVRAYVDGRLVHGSASGIPLEAGDEIVLELGAYVAPHSFFLFPPGGTR
jgi:hypothetical protein